MKDYYSILGVSPMSTRDEIKRRYRMLAKQFHPDTASNDPYAAARFQDIKEAYETLTQPVRKEAWLRERWLRQVYNAGTGEIEPLTPFSILEKVLRYERQVAGMDVFRMDHHGVVLQVRKLLCEENLDCLKRFQEPDMNRTILRHILLTLTPIPYSYTHSLFPGLEALAGIDPEALRLLASFHTNHRRKQKREKFTLPLIILATVLICLLIFLAGRH